MINEPKQTSEIVEQIKFAGPEDIAQIVAFGYQSFEENKLTNKGVSPSFAKTMQTVTDHVVNHVVLVKRNEDNDKLIDGVIAMEMTSVWWSDDPMLFSSLFYILPAKRSYKLAISLLNAAKEYAIMQGVPLAIDLIGDKDIAKKKVFLKRAGFNELGSFFVFNPLEGEENE